MNTKNHVQLIGNLGANPKIVTQTAENVVMSVTMATSSSWTDENGIKKEKTEWHNIVAFSKIATLFINHLKQGSKIMVIGSLQTRNYTDKNNVSRYTTEIIVSDVLFLDKAPEKKA